MPHILSQIANNRYLRRAGNSIDDIYLLDGYEIAGFGEVIIPITAQNIKIADGLNGDSDEIYVIDYLIHIYNGAAGIYIAPNNIQADQCHQVAISARNGVVASVGDDFKGMFECVVGGEDSFEFGTMIIHAKTGQRRTSKSFGYQTVAFVQSIGDPEDGYFVRRDSIWPDTTTNITSLWAWAREGSYMGRGSRWQVYKMRQTN